MAREAVEGEAVQGQSGSMPWAQRRADTWLRVGRQRSFQEGESPSAW